MSGSADHMRGIWGYNSPLLSSFQLPGLQKGFRLGRKFPGYKLTWPVFEGETPDLIRPYVFPLPESWTGDQWGVPFDSQGDVVVVAIRQGILDPLTLPYNEAFEEFWHHCMTFNDFPLFMVPATLPEGYTANPDVLWTSAVDFELDVSRTMPKYYDASGFFEVGPLSLTNIWGPFSNPWGYEGASFHWTGTTAGPVHLGPWTGAQVFCAYDSAQGLRNLAYRLTSITANNTQYAGNMDIVISHNADGSDPGAADGDTIDYSFSVAQSSLIIDPMLIGPTTGWVDLGPVNVTLGVPSVLQASMSSTGFTEVGTPFDGPNSIDYILEFRESVNLSIPWPTTALGIGSLIAPGGYL